MVSTTVTKASGNGRSTARRGSAMPKAATTKSSEKETYDNGRRQALDRAVGQIEGLVVGHWGRTPPAARAITGGSLRSTPATHNFNPRSITHR